MDKKENINRFWKPLVFYFYGPSKSGKTGLIYELFREELYEKQEKSKNGYDWWNGYESQDIVLLDDCDMKINFNDIMKLLSDEKFDIGIKFGGFKHMFAKYIFLTNIKSPEEVYNFKELDGNIEKFKNKIDYIIEFKGEWNNDITKRTTELVFHKENKNKFREMEWDGELFTKNINGEHFEEDEVVYWRREFPEFKKKYLCDYPKSRNELNPKIIKNYTITGGRLLFNNEKSLRSGSIILLDDGIIKDLEIIVVGKYSLFGDDGTDIMCNWNGYPLLIQCKFRSVCDKCIVRKKEMCSHGYWKRDIIKDVKSFDNKLSEYKIPIFGIFVISEGIKISNDI
ncbi:3606_t:CDS:2, partial [Cetraspora pellucida]